MELNKVKSFLGFAKKSRNIIYGVDDIVKSRKVQLVILSKELADNSKQKIEKFLENKNIYKFEIDKKDFADLLQSDVIKICAITDANLAKAINMNLLTVVSNGGNLE